MIQTLFQPYKVSNHYDNKMLIYFFKRIDVGKKKKMEYDQFV